jgi:hypothetical protein
MKSILLASALMISGVAYAQADPHDAGQPIGSGATLTPGTTMGERDTMGTNAATVQPDGTVTTPQTMPPATAEPMPPATTDTMPPATTDTMPPASTATDTTTMGTSGSGTVMVQQGGNMAPPPESTGPYPPCSRTVTDHCKQSSARESDTKGGPPAHRRRR